MTEPLISIIVPVYRVDDYLARAIESALAQTFTDFELILVDDCSPDGSGAICDRYAAVDARVRVVHKSVNEGAAAARNTGLSLARGKYIGFLDGDDFMDAGMYQYLFDLITAEGADVAEVSFFVTEEAGGEAPAADDGKILRFDRMGAMAELHNMRVQHDVLWNKLFRREVVPMLVQDRDAIIGEDYSLMVHVIEKCDKYVYARLPFYHYFQRAGSVCNGGYTKRHRGAVKNWSRYMAELSKKYPKLRGRIRSKLLFHEMSVLAAMARSGARDREVMKMIARDVRKNYFSALFGGYATPTAAVSMTLTAISPALMIKVCSILNR